MELNFDASSIIKTKYAILNMQEDYDQECLHVWKELRG